MAAAPRRALLEPSAGSGWFYVAAEEGEKTHVVTRDGRALARRTHGQPARVEVRDISGGQLPVAAWLRVAAAVGAARARHPASLDGVTRVQLVNGDVAPVSRDEVIELGAEFVTSQPSAASLREALSTVVERQPPIEPRDVPAPGAATPRVLFFESLMNSDMPHNDTEISQGVLHMCGALTGSDTEVVLANVKMPIVGQERGVVGLDTLEAALAGGQIGLVCITLLEGYWDGVVALIRALREHGCSARIAVGGVMPTLAPEHVACHLPEVSFVCRGAGEYFVPRLCEILGDTPHDAPLSAHQRAAFLQLEGLIVVDRPGRTLLCANSAKQVRVEDLDAVHLDLSHLQAKHIEGGIEISTSRGCVHHCTFCSIIGRGSYQARTPEGVFSLLERYERRFEELFGDHVPSNSYRVHISDDDFGCERDRAIRFLTRLRQTPFRLSSMQVSVADLCTRSGNKLLPEVARDWLDALDPELFADEGRPIPERDFVRDHKSRGWSSYLQIGVETFSDAELVRLGKGYRVEHIRAVVRALDEKRIHMDAYFIASNADTTAEDLRASIVELCRLKLRHPRHFHLRFPIVPHLVSYFTSASYRRKVRAGQLDTLALRGRATVEGYREFDYPFVDHDLPADPWVGAAVEANVITDDEFYTRSLKRLRAVWRERLAGLPERDATEIRRGERLVRSLDDLPRRLLFGMLEEARRATQRGDAQAEAIATRTVKRVLGDRDDWIAAYSRFAAQSEPRLVIIPTWQCELRCSYCFIPKQDGRVMSTATIERSIELLLSSERDRLQLQFFGGEALIEWENVQHAMRYGTQRATELGKELSFILSSNGFALDAEKLDWLKQYSVKLELSLDGGPEVQNIFRAPHDRSDDSYERSIASNADAILASGLPHEVIMVVHPKAAARVCESFRHVASLGFARIQINFMLGLKWTGAQMKSFAEGLFEIGAYLAEREQAGQPVELVNLDESPMPIRLHGEVTVDWDGTIYGGNAFLHETEYKQDFVVGHLNDLQSFDRYWIDAPENDYLLERGYSPDVTRNNLEVGKIMASFVRWMISQKIQAS